MTKSAFTFISDKIVDSFTWLDFKKTYKWCEENIIISGEVSGRTGYLSFEKYPWSKEILTDWDMDNLEEYAMLASTQVAKTTTQFCCIVKPLVDDPCMMMFVMASDKMVSDFVAEKFDPFVDGISALKEKIYSKQAEDASRLKNAVKVVPGGRVSFVGNTPINRRGKTVKYIFMDEAALYDHSDVEELKSRTKSFEGLGRKIFIVSSPMAADDPICTAYEEAYCKKELHMVCDKCNESFYPKAENFKYMERKEFREEHGDEFSILDYKRKAIKTAHVECPHCRNKITYKDLEQYVRKGRVKLVMVEGCDELDTKIGYRLNALATGLTNYEKIAEKLIEADDNEEKLAGIYREYFNEIYASKLAKDVLSEDILLLGNDYEEFEVPDDTLGLYLGVDSQKGYYWVTILAFVWVGIGLAPTNHLVYRARVEDLNTIEQLMDKEYFYKDKTRYYPGIRRGYHDWQGFQTLEKDYVINEDTGEVVEESILNMPQIVKEFAVKMADKYGANSDGTERYYATRGQQTLTNDEQFKLVNTSFKITGYNQERTIKTMVINTTYTKTTFMNTVVRNIAKQKSDSDATEHFYEERLHYVNKTVIEELKNAEKSVSTHYNRQITSEKYANHKDSKGKPERLKSWKGNTDNHYLDTNSSIMTAIQMDSLASQPRPVKQVDIKTDIANIKTMLM